MSWGRLFIDSFVAGDPGLLAPFLLNRVQEEDGLALACGRDAVIARWAALVSAFADRSGVLISEVGSGSTVAVALELSGHCTSLPDPLGAAAPAVACPAASRLRRHLWLRTERGRVSSIETVSAWWELADAVALDREAVAAAHGQAHPCHRPLGELASGRGQLIDEGTDLAARFNRRELGAWPDLLLLVAAMPDARLTADRVLGDAALWRLQGHVGGRRVCLPMSRIGDGGLLWDELARVAAAHRPFWPE